MMGKRMPHREEIQRVLQEKVARYLSVQQAIRAYQLVYEVQRRQLEELIVTKEALEGLKKKPPRRFEGFASLGSGTYIYVSGDMGDKVLVNVGANIGVYMSIDDALMILGDREISLRTNLENTAKTLRELMSIAMKLEQEIATLQEYLSRTK